MIQTHYFRYAVRGIVYQDLDLPQNHLAQHQIAKMFKINGSRKCLLST